jgi:hypothetical protein
MLARLPDRVNRVPRGTTGESHELPWVNGGRFSPVQAGPLGRPLRTPFSRKQRLARGDSDHHVRKWGRTGGRSSRGSFVPSEATRRCKRSSNADRTRVVPSTAHSRTLASLVSRTVVDSVLSNCTFDRGSICPTYSSPFDLLARGNETGNWPGVWDDFRNWIVHHVG